MEACLATNSRRGRAIHSEQAQEHLTATCTRFTRAPQQQGRLADLLLQAKARTARLAAQLMVEQVSLQARVCVGVVRPVARLMGPETKYYVLFCIH